MSYLVTNPMNRAFTITGVAVVSFILGATCMYLLKKTPRSAWVSVAPADHKIFFEMTTFNPDIPMPHLGTIEGRVKFLSRDKGQQLGYALKFPIEPNPTSALPEKYRRKTKLENGVAPTRPGYVRGAL